MDKYLFTDGTGGVKEAQSEEELKAWIALAGSPENIRIWIFNSNEWVSLANFVKRNPKFNNPAPTNGVHHTEPIEVGAARRRPWLKKFVFGVLAVATILLVYNFTRVNWQKASALSVMAERPDNVPVMNIDSLLAYLEATRGQKLDRITKTNVRIRNSWPDLIQLQLTANRDTSNAGTRFSGVEISIDNSTGYHIDKAVVRVTAWKSQEVNREDTFHIANINYAAPIKRLLKGGYRGDSLSVMFESIAAKSFNFCYSVDKQSNYGNNNDRWFCRE